MARRNLEIVFPWKPFAGAYMAPVPEVAPTSAITLADQIPAALLESIPADQRQAYIDQWPMMTGSERQLVRSTYGMSSAPHLATRQAAQIGTPPEPPALQQPNNGAPMAIPSDLLSQWWALSADEQLVVLQTYGMAVPVDILTAWSGLSPDERKIVVETYIPGTHLPTASAPFRGNTPANLASAAGGNWILLAGAAFAAWWLLRKK